MLFKINSVHVRPILWVLKGGSGVPISSFEPPKTTREDGHAFHCFCMEKAYVLNSQSYSCSCLRFVDLSVFTSNIGFEV